MTGGLLIVAGLVGLAVLIAFMGMWRLVRVQDPVEERIKQIGASGEAGGAGGAPRSGAKRAAWPGVTRLLAGFGLGPRLAQALTYADSPLTAAEFALIVVGTATLGLVLGLLRGGLLLGLLLGAVTAFLPIFYIRLKASRRQRAFMEQLPDVLTLLTGALRAGYGMAQAIEMLVQQLPPPASKEFGRVMQGIGLGLSLQQALHDMAERVGIDDLDLVVTAVGVQYEMGGNLAQMLETIGTTIRDRIRIKRQIRVLTAQQRLTGYVLAVWPFFLAVAIFILNPGYIRQLWAPGLVRLLPVTAVLLQIVGFFVIRRIVDIEV